MSPRLRLVLVRHGETEWSREGRHTGRTDIPLTERGRRQAIALRPLLDHLDIARVLCSPLMRARDTAELCGLGGRAEVCDDLVEWDYGDMDGLTTPEIRQRHPGWSIFESGVTGGESLDDVAVRARRVIALCDGDTGDVALVAHGHLLRVLAACWLSLPPVDARLLSLSTATLSVLGWEHETRVVQTWNVSPGDAGA